MQLIVVSYKKPVQDEQQHGDQRPLNLVFESSYMMSFKHASINQVSVLQEIELKIGKRLQLHFEKRLQLHLNDVSKYPCCK